MLISCFLLSITIAAVRSLNDDDYFVDESVDQKPNPLEEVKTERSHHEDMTRLQQMIKNKNIDPVRPPQLPISIGIQSLTLENIMFDEHAQTLSGFLLVNTGYFDRRLRWNASEFDGMRFVTLQGWDIWSPQFVPLNSVKSFGNADTVSFIHWTAKVYTTGYDAIVNSFPVQHITVDCEVDASNYPFDEQNCTIILADVQFGRDFVFERKQNPMNLEKKDYYENLTNYNGWNVKSKTATYASTLHDLELNDVKRTTNALEIQVVLQRDISFYYAIMVCPSLVFAALSGLSFMLPNHRLVLFLVGSNLLLLAIFMTSIKSKLPTNYNSQPAILSFWQVEMVLTSMQLIICVARLISSPNLKQYLNPGVLSIIEKANGILYWVFLAFTVANVAFLLLPVAMRLLVCLFAIGASIFANFCHESPSTQIDLIVGKLRTVLEEVASDNVSSGNAQDTLRHQRDSKAKLEWEQAMAIYLKKCQIKLNEDAIARYKSELAKMLMDGIDPDIANYEKDLMNRVRAESNDLIQAQIYNETRAMHDKI